MDDLYELTSGNRIYENIQNQSTMVLIQFQLYSFLLTEVNETHAIYPVSTLLIGWSQQTDLMLNLILIVAIVFNQISQLQCRCKYNYY